MLKLAQQSRQPHNQHKLNSTGTGAGVAKMQYPGLQVLADKMRARLTNTNCEIDQDIFERFYKHLLPVTFLDWMCKP